MTTQKWHLTKEEWETAHRIGVDRHCRAGDLRYIDLVRRQTVEADPPLPSLTTQALSVASLAAARTYDTKQAHLESLVLSCPYREPITFSPSEPRPCGCTARCRRGRGRPEDGLVGHHVCLQCVAGV
jgi:hypothetical protein